MLYRSRSLSKRKKIFGRRSYTASCRRRKRSMQRQQETVARVRHIAPYFGGWTTVQASRIDYAAIAKGTCEAAEGLRGLPREGASRTKQLQGADRDKSTEVDRLSFAGLAARLLVIASEKPWWNLRAYFLTKAEYCKDLLTDARVRCQ